MDPGCREESRVGELLRGTLKPSRSSRSPILTTAVDLGLVKVDDVVCRYLLFGEEDADWQLWVDTGKRPLPRRLSVVYKKAPGAPRSLAAVSDWKLNITVPASRVVFVKPAQANQGVGCVRVRRLDCLVVGRVGASTPAGQGRRSGRGVAVCPFGAQPATEDDAR
jgi:hypothetical protein